jgi:hypothetical protein
VDKRFRYLAQEVLKQKKVLSFGYNYFKHSAINSQIIGSEFDIKSDKMKTILKKCPNIKCLQMSELVINKLLFKWLSKNCKQLVCIHISSPKSFLKTPKIAFKGIGNLLNDKIEIEINLGYNKNMREDSVIALIRNMPQIKEIDFHNDFHFNNISIDKLYPHFGRNIRSFSNSNCLHLTIEDLNVIKNNTNLVELKLFSCYNNSQQIFDFICDKLTQLKTLYFDCNDDNDSISLSKITTLTNLENLWLSLRWKQIEFSFMDKKSFLNKLLSLEIKSTSMTPTLFEKFVQNLPNIEKLSIIDFEFICEHQIDEQNYKYDCFQCNDKALKCLSKLNRLKNLKMFSSECHQIKALVNNINEQTFKPLEELNLCIIWYSKLNELKQLFLNLIQLLKQLCDRNPKQLFTFRIDPHFKELISEKQTINGIEYNVLFDCEKFETNFGKKFEIPKNMRIIIKAY